MRYVRPQVLRLSKYDYDYDPDESEAQRHKRQLVLSAQRSVCIFLLRHMGYKYREIAERSGYSGGRVNQLLLEATDNPGEYYHRPRSNKAFKRAWGEFMYGVKRGRS
jgi:DNA-directed RNA polymerase specialized sigma24 family protein